VEEFRLKRKKGPNAFAILAHNAPSGKSTWCCALNYKPQFGLYLHNGMGPSFNSVEIGAAIAKQVQATATTRTKVLTARFMAFSLRCGSPGSGNPFARDYICAVKS
jgi:hypothetical protein